MDPELSGGLHNQDIQEQSVDQTTDDFQFPEKFEDTDNYEKFKDSPFLEYAKEEYQELLESKNTDTQSEVDGATDKIGVLQLQMLQDEFNFDLKAMSILSSASVIAKFQEHDCDIQEVSTSLQDSDDSMLEENFYSYVNLLGEEGIKSYLDTNEFFDLETFVMEMEEGSNAGKFEMNSILNVIKNKANGFTQAESDFINSQLDKLLPQASTEKKLQIESMKEILKVEVKSDKVEVKSDKVEVKSDKVEVKSDNEEINNEKTEKLHNAIKDINLDNLSGDITIKYLDEINQLKDFIKSKDIDKLINDIADNNEGFINFFNKLGSENINIYTQYYNAFSEIPEFSNFVQNLTPPDKLGIVKKFTGDTEEIINVRGGDEMRKVGDKMYGNGKMIDLSEYPPKYYVVGEGGYRVDTTLSLPQEYYDIKEDFKEKKGELQSDINSKKSEIKIIQQEIDTLGEGTKVDELKLRLNTLNTEVVELQEQLKTLQSDTEYNIRTILLEFEEDASKLDEEAKQVTKFVSEIGFDAIPQNISNFIFNLISETNPIKVGGQTITGIDPKTFTLTGTFSPSLGEGGITDMNTKRVFMQLMNKMITGSEDIPININSYYGGTPQYRKSVEGNEVMGNDKLAGFIRKNINLDSGNPYSKIQENIGMIKNNSEIEK